MNWSVTKICRLCKQRFPATLGPEDVPFFLNCFSLQIFQSLHYLPTSWTGSYSFISLLSALTPCTSPPTLVARSYFPQYSSPLLNEKINNSKYIARCSSSLFSFLFYLGSKRPHKGSKAFRCDEH